MQAFTNEYKKELKQSVGTEAFFDTAMTGLAMLSAAMLAEREIEDARQAQIFDACTPVQLAALARLVEKMHWNVGVMAGTQVQIYRDNMTGFVSADGTYGKH